MRTQAIQWASLLLEDDTIFTTRLGTKELEINDLPNEIYAANRSEANPHGDVDVEGELLIKWSADIEARDWGIKDISPHIRSITGVITITDLDTDRVIEEIDVSWPRPPALSGTPPTPEAAPKDWIEYTGSPPIEWDVEYEADFAPAAQRSWGMTPTGAKVSITGHNITVTF